MQTKLWPTEPLKSWQKCKELRLKHYRDVAEARSQGKVLVTGGLSEVIILPAGLGDFVFFCGEPYGASISVDTAFSEQCAEAAEAKGWARDLCSYYRDYMGSVYLDKYLFGGAFPRPDFCLTLHNCDSHAKWYQQASEQLKTPFFGVDLVNTAPGRHVEERTEYIAGQLYDAIEWMEKVTGRRYDDEKFIEALHTECEMESLWAEICILNQAVPAPLDHKSMWSLYLPVGILKWDKETLEFYRMLRDEVRDRVDRGIAAVATERCRLLHDSQPPWFFLRVFRIMEQYGAVCVGSQYCFGLVGFFSMGQDGRWEAARTPRQMGIQFKSREEALRFLARKIVYRPIGDGVHSTVAAKRGQIMGLVKQWHADGMVIHLNRGCEGLAQLQLETRLALLQEGVPVMTYEGNMSDKREFDEAQVIDRVEAFMESLGLQKLPD